MTSNNYEDVYYITFLTDKINIKENENITLYGLPLDYSTYIDTSRDSIWCIKIAGVCVE